MSEDNCCKCSDLSVGPVKSTANSFTFQMCDGDSPVGVPATNIATYITNVIFGDNDGAALDEGCYVFCYDSNGVQNVETSLTKDQIETLVERKTTVNWLNDEIYNDSTTTNQTINIDISSLVPATATTVIVSAQGIQNSDGFGPQLFLGGRLLLYVRSDGNEDDTGSNNQGIYPVPVDRILNFTTGPSLGFDSLVIALHGFYE